MLKRNWKFLFVVFSQTVDLLSIWLAGAVIFTLKWNGIVQYVTPDDHLRMGFIIFAVIYVVIASMMELYRGSFIFSNLLLSWLSFLAKEKKYGKNAILDIIRLKK